MKTILLIDDDLHICQSIDTLLKKNGFDVFIANDSQHAEKILTDKNKEIHLILLDLMLPGEKNGIAICKTIREKSHIPIIMLTGVEEDIERIISLEIGADYYLTKPFNSRVLIAYINAVLRRSNLQNTESEENTTEFDVFEFVGWKLNATIRVLLSPDNEVTKITNAEFTLLQAFLSNPQRILSRDKLMSTTNASIESFDRSIDILMSRLRRKIEKKYSKIFVTVRNGGYLLSCKVKRSKINHLNWEKFLLCSKSI